MGKPVRGPWVGRQADLRTGTAGGKAAFPVCFMVRIPLHRPAAQYGQIRDQDTSQAAAPVNPRSPPTR